MNALLWKLYNASKHVRRDKPVIHAAHQREPLVVQQCGIKIFVFHISNEGNTNGREGRRVSRERGTKQNKTKKSDFGFSTAVSRACRGSAPGRNSDAKTSVMY